MTQDYAGVTSVTSVTTVRGGVSNSARFTVCWQVLYTEHLSAVHCNVLTVLGVTV